MWRANAALLALCSLLALLSLAPLEPPAPRCPRTRRPAHHRASIRHDGRCWQVLTCSPECGAALRDAEALAQHLPSVRAEGLLLHHRGEPVQTAAPCS